MEKNSDYEENSDEEILKIFRWKKILMKKIKFFSTYMKNDK